MQQLELEDLIIGVKYYIQIVNLSTLNDPSGSGRLSGVFDRNTDDMMFGFIDIREIPGGNSGSGISGSSFFYSGEINVFKIGKPGIINASNKRLMNTAMTIAINNNGFPIKNSGLPINNDNNGLGGYLSKGYFDGGQRKRRRTHGRKQKRTQQKRTQQKRTQRRRTKRRRTKRTNNRKP